MKKLNFTIGIIKMFIGFFIVAMASIMMINANIGLLAWDVLHQGMSKQLGITIGQASISVGVLIVILDVILGENIGWGTILNMIFIGVFMDLVIYLDFIPHAHNLVTGLTMDLVGLVLTSIGSYLYLTTRLGSGPRDGLMIALHKKTKKSVRLIRTILEVAALIVGWILGGTIGVGTIICAVALGYVMQFIFKLFKLDTTTIVHRSIFEDVRAIKAKFKHSEEVEEKII